jgi:hypothetical protein
MAWRRIISKVPAAGMVVFALVASMACGAASVIDIRSDGTTPAGIEVVDGTGTEPDITAPPKSDAKRTVPRFQETALGDGWSAMLIDALRATDKELQNQFQTAPDLPAGKQYLVALVQVRYIGSETVKSTDTVEALALDSSSKSAGEACAIPLAEFVSPVNVPAGQAAVLYKCFVVDSTVSTDVVLGMVNTKGAPTVARFRLDESAIGSVFTPFDGTSPFAIDDYLVTMSGATVIEKPAPGATAVPVKVTVSIADAKVGAVGQLRFGLISPGRGAAAITNCEGGEAATPGTATSSAAGNIAICVLDRAGSGNLVGWVQAPTTGTIAFFAVSAE